MGCPHKCYHCSNPELWASDESKNIAVSDLISKLYDYKNKADGVTITGGDPFFQAEELYELLKGLNNSQVSRHKKAQFFRGSGYFVCSQYKASASLGVSILSVPCGLFVL